MLRSSGNDPSTRYRLLRLEEGVAESLAPSAEDRVEDDPGIDDRLVFRPRRDAPAPATPWLAALGLRGLERFRRRRRERR